MQPIATCVHIVVWSVCLSVCVMVMTISIVEMSNGLRCYLGYGFWLAHGAMCQIGLVIPHGERNF